MLQIYNENITDLFVEDKQPLKIRLNKDEKMEVRGLSQIEVKDEKHCMKPLDKGSGNKNIAATDMNAGSSRSHCIFTLEIESSEMGEDGEPKVKKGKLNLVDLAGSER